jgi:ubiquinone/menaquinone biosynthesis C-methylase UbiE
MVFEELLGEINGGKVLDVACGSGQFIEILVKSLKSFESITGIDLDETVLSEARERFPAKTFRFRRASSESLAYDDGSFDLVSVSKALHHMEDDRKSLSEMMRVLKQGGNMLISEMIRDGLSEPQRSHMMYHHLRVDIDQLIGISHRKTYTRNDLVAVIQSLGLNDLLLTDYQPPEPAPNDPEYIAEYFGKMKGWLAEIDGHPSCTAYRQRVDALRERIMEHGISKPTHIIAFGMKT